MIIQQISVMAVKQLCSSPGSPAEIKAVRCEGLTAICLPAGWQSGIIYSSNIPLGTDCPSRTHLLQKT